MGTYQELKEKTYKSFHLFCGIGGGALGFQQAEAQYKGVPGRFRTLGGVDVDPQVCKDFEMITGVPATCMDLFTATQYEAFHGKKPPEGWKEATPTDILRASRGEYPDVIFQSSPCKGYSGLLPTKSAQTPKYQALNELALHGIELMLKAFEADLPAAILFENVPRITSRGAHLLDRIIRLLEAHGYLVHQATHDCGEIGGLAQHRLRYLLIARNVKKLQTFIYKPPKLRVKAIGEVLTELPMPDDSSSGPMHRMPRLTWLTWTRLALIPPGGDWRDLEEFAPQDDEARKKWEQDGVKTDGETHLFKGKYAVIPWDRPSRTVIGGASNGASYVADPRLKYEPRGGGPFGVMDWEKPAATVIGNSSIKGSNATAIADPRVPVKEGRHPSHFRVIPWEEPAKAITGADHVANGATCIADPRLKHGPRPGAMGVMDWEKPSSPVIGNAHVGGSTPVCIADPRLKPSDKRHPAVYRVVKFDEPAPCVVGSRFGSGAPAVADPRVDTLGDLRFPADSKSRYSNKLQVHFWEKPAACVTGMPDIQSGAPSVADPRIKGKSRPGLFGVADWEKPINTISGNTWVSRSNAVAAVADPRLKCECRSGSYGVMEWEKPAKTIVGSQDVHQGIAAVADPRVPEEASCDWVPPLPNMRLDPPPIIISLDGSHHRPLTTLELASLQGFPVRLPDGNPLILAGKSDSKWRERIGNAVPPMAAKAIAEQVLMALLPNSMGETFVLGSTDIWVKNIKDVVLRLATPNAPETLKVNSQRKISKHYH